MRLGFKQWLKVPVLLALLGTSQCGGKGKSGQTEITADPDKPIVFSADAGDTLKAPWFKFSIDLTNNSDEPVTIVALEVTVTSDNGGGLVETVTTFDPSAYSTTITVNDTSVQCNYFSFGTINPNESKALQLNNGTTDCPSYSAIFYVSNVPVSKDNPNYRFRVKVKPVGWFGTLAEPTDRYSRTKVFTTQ